MERNPGTLCGSPFSDITTRIIHSPCFDVLESRSRGGVVPSRSPILCGDFYSSESVPISSELLLDFPSPSVPQSPTDVFESTCSVRSRSPSVYNDGLESASSEATSRSPSSLSSDVFEPISPGYSIDSVRTTLSVQSASVRDSPVPQDPVPEETKTVLTQPLMDFSFLHTLPVGTPEAVLAHVQQLIDRQRTGTLGLPDRSSITDSETPYTDIAQPKKPGKEGSVKRPMNHFMIFAQRERINVTAAHPELHNALVSQHLGRVWHQCPQEVKQAYQELAQWLKELHRQENPDYKYRPRKRKSSGGSGVGSSSPSSSGEDGDAVPRPSKRARKTTSRPRKRTRRPTGQSHVVPASSVPEPLPTVDHNVELYPEVVPAPGPGGKSHADLMAEVSRLVHDDVKSTHRATAQAPADPEPDLIDTQGGGRGDVAAGGEEPVAAAAAAAEDQAPVFDGLDMGLPSWSLDDLEYVGDMNGFQFSSDNLIEGSQLHEALEFEGEIDNFFDLNL